ncbi:MAG: hypothetical protein A2287_09425 [Candidatus Melainabacteria bacterium RIFOXYA12_FULL_32_12]|nr:MAG: hypothetical protein A2287_09425 [Candidatus Melainabacteria bacterium RIFOXYA12_FULL_32_12]
MTLESQRQDSYDEFLTVQEASKLLKTTPKTLYTYLSNSGVYNGKARKRLPQKVYRKLGRKVLFMRNELISWIKSGAELVDSQEEK